jgi:hypothetical protein
MSARDTQPTEPFPEALMIPGEPEPRRRRVWPWIVAFVIVAGLAVAAWFAADLIARQVITGVVREGVRTQLSLPADQQIDVELTGAVVPQLISGSFDEVTISSDDVEFGGVTGDVTVSAHDVAVSTEFSMSGATATVALDEAQLRTLMSSVDGFPADTVALAAPNVTMSVDLQLFGVGIPVGVGLTPSAAEGDIVLTPDTLEVGGSTLSADALRQQFGALADAVLRDWNVCIADQLPAGVTLTDVDVVGGELVADFDVDGAIATDPALRANGTCA